MSLLMSLVFGWLLLYTGSRYSLVEQDIRRPLAVAAVLAVVMLYRFVRTGAVMPAGVVAALRCVLLYSGAIWLMLTESVASVRITVLSCVSATACALRRPGRPSASACACAECAASCFYVELSQSLPEECTFLWRHIR
jgi:hypothetical protein